LFESVISEVSYNQHGPNDGHTSQHKAF